MFPASLFAVLLVYIHEDATEARKVIYGIMVANLSIGKGEFDKKYDSLCELAENAQQVKDQLVSAVDADTEAFNEVLNAMRMPKDTPQASFFESTSNFS